MKKLFLLSLTLLTGMLSWAAKYTLVTSTTDLQAGDKIVFGVADKAKASGAFNTSYLAAVDATFSGDTLSAVDAVDITVQGGGSSWTFYIDGQQLGATAEKSLSIDNSNSSFVGGWTVTIDEYGDATILLSTPKFANTNLYYNANAARFCNYASKQTALQIYKKVPVEGEHITASDLNMGKLPLVNGTASNNASLKIEGDNLTEAISYELADGTNFSASGTLTAGGGTLSIAFSADAEGTYNDTLLLSADSAWLEVALTASVVPASVRGNKYVLVSNLSAISAGDELILVSTAHGKVATDIASSIMGTEDVTIATDKTITLADTSAAVIFTLGGVKDAWTLSNVGQLLSCTAAKKMAWTTTSSAASQWTISIDASSNATIKNNNTGTDFGFLCYNTSSPRFTTYTATSASCILPQLYQRQASVPTALDNTYSTVACQKIFCDGQVLIIRGENTYTVLGQPVLR